MNKVELCGRLTNDPEVRYSQGEKSTAIARYTLAVDRRFKQEGQPTADFIPCVAFGKNGEFAEKYLHKGTKVIVIGRIQTGSYTNKDGQKVYTTDVMVEEQTEDILKMGGVAKEETLDSTLGESIKLRLPWLFVNLITAFLASMTVKSFESTIAQVVALSSIMSIITGMGGNAGTQTVSIIIRNIARGKVELKDAWHLLGKQVLLGVINGAIIGLVTGTIVCIIYGNIYLGIIVFLAMIANLVISGICGILIPLVLEKMKIDPALSSSIFLTTATDVLGFFIFLSLAKIFLPYLI